MATVFASSVIPAPAADVWAVIRSFNALPDWHPMIASSRIEQGKAPDQIGCIRNFSLTDGNRTFAEWQAQFDCSKADESELVSSIGNDVFQGGFSALKQRFA